jgi:hypothetical protein
MRIILGAKRQKVLFPKFFPLDKWRLKRRKKGREEELHQQLEQQSKRRRKRRAALPFHSWYRCFSDCSMTQSQNICVIVLNCSILLKKNTTNILLVF